jgi:hypothetical protein
VSGPDILRLPYDDSLTQAGIEYARKSLHYTYNRMELGPGARLRKIVAGVAVELALRRWLQAEGVPFDVLGQTPFTERDRYDIRLGGRRCDVKSFMISDLRQAAALRADPAWLYQAEALVPADQLRSSSLDEQDFYVFGFLAASESERPAQVRADMGAGRPVHLLHTFAAEPWVGKLPWATLGRLVLKTDGGTSLELEVGGQDRSRAGLVERLRLEPLQRTETAGEFYTLLYLHTPRLPEAVLGVHSPAHRRTALIKPGAWQNIWVYGQEVFIAGWLTKAEFRRRSRRLPAGSRVRQYRRTQTENRSVPVTALRSIRELAELIKQHAG